jgi:hypothetical protein
MTWVAERRHGHEFPLEALRATRGLPHSASFALLLDDSFEIEQSHVGVADPYLVEELQFHEYRHAKTS